MSTIETVTVVLGWCTVLNLGMLAFTGVIVMAMRKLMMQVHARMFGVNETELPGLYFQYMAQYQLGILILNLAPYLALKIIT